MTTDKTLMFEEQFPQAIQYHRTGRLQEAKALYEQLLQTKPDHSDVLHLLGVVEAQLKNIPKAIELITKAIQINPKQAAYHSNLANIYKEQQQFEKAIVCYQQAVLLAPNHIDAYNQMGIVFSTIGKLPEAVSCFRQTMAIDPNNAEGYSNLGIVLRRQGKFKEAIEYYQKALALRPTYAEAHINFGIALEYQGHLIEAAQCYSKAIHCNPNLSEAHNNLGNVLRLQGKLTEAAQCYEQALKLTPNYLDAAGNLGGILKDKGLIDQAIQYYRQVLINYPQVTSMHSNLVFTLNYSATESRSSILAEHDNFYQQQAANLTKQVQLHQNLREPNKKLKIGYVSGDFRSHSAAYFILPIFEQHDHEQYEVYCYYTETRYDQITEAIKQQADYWLDCAHLNDEALAQQIREDEIDILVDLSGHTAGNRLLVFARKPAPVQVTYMGYPSTTGIKTIDYRITDYYLDPEDKIYGPEIPLRMPADLICYAPPQNTPPVNELPAKDKGYITFSCFNHYYKLNQPLIETWAKILQRVPNSKLLLKSRVLSNDSDTRQNFETQLLLLGIATDRLIIEDADPVPQHLNAYHQVDIALDSHPYNGGTTTCEALWMGIPVVTWVGDIPPARVGLAHLSTLGLHALIAKSSEEYVDICVNLANDLERLSQLRQTLRETMQASPLMDAPTFVKHLEIHYRQIWQKWCES